MGTVRARWAQVEGRRTACRVGARTLIRLHGTSKARRSRTERNGQACGRWKADGKQFTWTRDRALGEGDNNKANFPESEFPEKNWDIQFSVRKGTYSKSLVWVVCKDRTQRPSGRDCSWLTQLPVARSFTEGGAVFTLSP